MQDLTTSVTPSNQQVAGWARLGELVLRRSYATWLVEAGGDPKAVQGQMRISHQPAPWISSAQFVPAAQRRAVELMMDMVDARSAKASR